MINMGCRVNQYEGAVMDAACAEAGFARAAEGEAAQVVVINTCSVTHASDSQARRLIRRAQRENPGARIVVTGCYAQRAPETLAAIEGVDLVLGNQEKLDLAAHLARADADAPIRVGDPFAESSGPFPPLAADAAINPDAPGFGGRARAFLQIQNGCDKRCTFCLIPGVRGPSRSLSLEAALEAGRAFVAQGFGELVLTGIDLGAYGADLGLESGLATLCEQLMAVPGLKRLRLSSIDPEDIDEALIALFADASSPLCPHLHLSIQSGDDRILKRMHRVYDRDLVLRKVAALRHVRPDMVFGADLIVGFPTEDDDAFAQTLALAEAIPLAMPHVFRYSDRPNTPAQKIPQRFRVADSEMKRRSEALIVAGAGHLQAAAERALAEGACEVLVETVDQAGMATGKRRDFLPVRIRGAQTAQSGALLTVQLEAFVAESQTLVGKVL
ncbi:putative MiaB-like tRNA modifying enzyme [Magnetofaba australis IT-1]|uniref:Putative MiaB-like tRNA modifying enzyme n=1 Tax=Magnetofaba australis IT-1 TaxID=1434232 RepID=A0A1Y2K681_9PROT|nr:putative MiaB-like tRNA modifying enzyme [Magnetofaba australis IT-1]